MHIKITIRYHLTPVRMALSKRQEITSIGEDVEKRETCVLLVKCKLVQPLWKTVWRFLKKLKIELPYDPAILLMGICPKEIKTLTQKDLGNPTVIAVLFIIVKIWK